jgi:hypothetical protein
VPWSFIDACARGQLPLDECNPVFYLAAIGVLLLISVFVLARLMVRRVRKSS